MVRWYGGALARGEKERAASAARLAFLADGLISLLGFGLIIILAPWAAEVFARDPQMAPWFVVYGAALLGSLVYESASGVLQVGRRFDRIALANSIQSVITTGGVTLAYFLQADIPAVLAAYLFGKLASGWLVSYWAWQELDLKLGPGWFRTPFSQFGDRAEWRTALSFALNTNLHGTVNLIVRDSEPLLINALLSPVQGGYFKIAMGLINLVVLPVDPLIAPTYTELNSAAMKMEWGNVRRLLKRVSMLSASWVLAAGGGLAVLGWWLIPLMYGADAAPAYPAYLLLMAGYGFAAIFQWNRALLLVFDLSGFPLVVTALLGMVKTIISLLVAPALGYLAEAANLAVYFILSIGVLVWRGLSELRRRDNS